MRELYKNAAHCMSGNQSQLDPVLDKTNYNQIGGENQSQVIPMKGQNLGIARQFLTQLDEEAESFTFQVFDDKGKQSGLARVIHGSFEEHFEELCRFQERGAGIFVTVNKTNFKGRKKDDILTVRAFFVDLDGSPLEPVLDAPVAPNIVIESSPGRYHGYWVVEGCPLERFSIIQKQLAERFDGDPSVNDLGRVMRLPGFYHQKSEPFLSHIIQESCTPPIPFSEFEKLFDLHEQEKKSMRIDDPIFQALLEKGMIKKEDSSRSGCYSIVCPWESSHSNVDLGTKYYLAGYNGYTTPGFKCFHDHCQDKTIRHLEIHLNLSKGKQSGPLPLHREIEDPKPYPINALGEILAPAARALQSIIRAPDAVCAQSVLGAAALACQAFGNIHIDGREIPLSLFMITVAESGERKSAADRVALKPIYEWQHLQNSIYRKDLLNYQRKFEVWKARKKDFIKNIIQSDGQSIFNEMEPEKPLDPLLIVDEPTYEGAVKLLAVGQPSIGIFSDEGGRFFGGHAMGRDNQIKTISGLSSLWDGRPINRSRAGDGSMVLYGRRVSLHLMIQESILELLMGNKAIEQQGFLPRCLLSFPTSTAGSRPYSHKDVNDSRELVQYWSRINDLLDRKFPTDPLPAPQNELKPPFLTLTQDAKSAWVEFHDATDRELKTGGRWEVIRRFGSKAAEHVLRLAGVLAMVDDPSMKVIEEKFIHQGISLVEYYMSEILRVQGCLLSPYSLMEAQKVLDWCWSKGIETLPLRQLYQNGPVDIRDAKKARAVMKTLEDHLWAHRTEERKEEWLIVRK